MRNRFPRCLQIDTSIPAQIYFKIISCLSEANDGIFNVTPAILASVRFTNRTLGSCSIRRGGSTPRGRAFSESVLSPSPSASITRGSFLVASPGMSRESGHSMAMMSSSGIISDPNNSLSQQTSLETFLSPSTGAGPRRSRSVSAGWVSFYQQVSESTISFLICISRGFRGRNEDYQNRRVRHRVNQAHPVSLVSVGFAVAKPLRVLVCKYYMVLKGLQRKTVCIIKLALSLTCDNRLSIFHSGAPGIIWLFLQ